MQRRLAIGLAAVMVGMLLVPGAAALGAIGDERAGDDTSARVAVEAGGTDGVAIVGQDVAPKDWGETTQTPAVVVEVTLTGNEGSLAWTAGSDCSLVIDVNDPVDLDPVCVTLPDPDVNALIDTVFAVVGDLLDVVPTHLVPNPMDFIRLPQI